MSRFSHPRMPTRLSSLDSDSGPSLHTVYAYLTGLMLALVEIKYQGLNTSPFREHPALMILFLIAITVYVMALIVMRSNHQINSIMVCVCHVSGSVACELLLLLLVSPIWGFIVNVSSLVLFLILLFCYTYLFQPSLLEEAQATEMTDIEAAPASA